MTRFIECFGEDTLLSSIEYGHLKNYRNSLMKRQNRNGGLFTASSINSEISCFRHMFREASEYKMIERNPFNDGKTLRLEVNNVRDRYLTPEEARRLVNACPVHLRHIVRCALYKGMRLGNILNLNWNQIRGGWIYIDTKTGKRKIPVSDKLAELFDHIKNNQKPIKGNVFDLKGRPVEKAGTQSEFVFTYNGKPITEIRRSFRRAVKKAVMVYGIYEPDGVTFHTLLHTYGSYLMQQKTDFRTAQELMGHRDPKMTQRYTHVADNSKRCAVDGLNWESHVS